MQYVKCAICDSDESKPFYPAESGRGRLPGETFTLVKCRNCGLVYLNPRPEGLEAVRLYPEEYYPERSGRAKGLLKAIISFSAFLRRERVYEYKTSGKILDVGCGNGDFLFSMRERGWDVYGMETSESGSRLCREKNLNVRRDFNFPEDYFDVVTLWHSMEHMENPAAALKKIHEVLSTGGLLFISLPNIESIEYGLFKRLWFPLQLPAHIYHFSPSTLEKLLHKTGFKVLKISHYSLEYNPGISVQNLMNVFTPESGFFYEVVRKGRGRGGKSILNLAVMIVALLVFAVPAFCLAYFFSFLKRGGVIHVYAEKIR